MDWKKPGNESRTIKQYKYDPTNTKLTVQFKKGDIWEYDCPGDMYNEFEKAKSIGSYFTANIKNRSARKLEREDKPVNATKTKSKSWRIR